MSGNSIGRLFTVTSFGESHGPAIGAIVDGCPPGMLLTEADLQKDLDRRRPGTSRYTSQRKESDRVEILSGVFSGCTTGTPIGLLIRNQDQRSRDYSKIKNLFRPGHADFTYQHKYGIRDYRGGGRSSARETAVRVAAGAIAKKYLLAEHNCKIQGYITQIGDYQIRRVDPDQIECNPFFCPDPDLLPDLERLIASLLKAGDSIGARIRILCSNPPRGLGEPVFDRLDADIAHAMMGINAVKGVEIGDGFRVVNQRGSVHRDEITPDGFLTNHSGGILGGISTGQDLIIEIALKPASSIRIPGRTTTCTGEAAEVVTTGRHDPCVGIRAVPIAEAMLAIVLVDHLLRHRGQNSSS